MSVAFGSDISSNIGDEFSSIEDIAVELNASVESLIDVKATCPTLIFEVLGEKELIKLNGFDEDLFVINFQVSLDGDDDSDGLTISNRLYPLNDIHGTHNNRKEGITVDGRLEMDFCSIREKLLSGVHKVCNNGSFDLQKITSARCRVGLVNPFVGTSPNSRTVLYTNYYSYNRDEFLSILDHVTKNPPAIPEGLRIEPRSRAQMK